MAETRKLVKPGHEDAPSLVDQVHEICAQAVREAGGYLVEHPEDGAFIVVFGGHEVAVKVSNWDIRR